MDRGRGTLFAEAIFEDYRIDPPSFADSLTVRLEFRSERSWEAWFFST
jgi:hypothetical protein